MCRWSSSNQIGRQNALKQPQEALRFNAEGNVETKAMEDNERQFTSNEINIEVRVLPLREYAICDGRWVDVSRWGDVR